LPKHYIIDGNNLIGKIDFLKSLQRKDKQGSRERLAFLIERYFAHKKDSVSIHFDGFANEPIKVSKVKLSYSEKLTADELIKKEIDRTKNPKNVVVVSSDNNLRQYARLCSCSTVTSEEFRRILLSSESIDEEKERINKLGNSEEFKKLFGVDQSSE